MTAPAWVAWVTAVVSAAGPLLWGAERMGLIPAGSTARGVWLSAAVCGAEAIDGELEGAGEFGLGRNGLDGTVGVRRIGAEEGTLGDAVHARLAWRGDAVLVSCGIERWRWGAYRRLGYSIDGSLVLSRMLLVGGGGRAFPEEPAGADQAHLFLLFGDGAWSGALRFGPDAGAWMAAVSVLARAHVLVTAAYDGAAPEIGVAWRGGRGEFAVRGRQHPLLGATAEIRVVAGGGRP